MVKTATIVPLLNLSLSQARKAINLLVLHAPQEAQRRQPRIDVGNHLELYTLLLHYVISHAENEATLHQASKLHES